MLRWSTLSSRVNSDTFCRLKDQQTTPALLISVSETCTLCKWSENTVLAQIAHYNCLNYICKPFSTGQANFLNWSVTCLNLGTSEGSTSEAHKAIMLLGFITDSPAFPKMWWNRHSTSSEGSLLFFLLFFKNRKTAWVSQKCWSRLTPHFSLQTSGSCLYIWTFRCL